MAVLVGVLVAVAGLVAVAVAVDVAVAVADGSITVNVMLRDVVEPLNDTAKVNV